MSRLIFLFFTFASLAFGQFPFGDLEQPHVVARLLTAKPTIEAGETLDVALVLDHEEHWHTYYVNPGQAGFAPSIDWQLPEGFEAGDLTFPTPILGTFAGTPFYGYDGETWFFTTVKVPDHLEAGEITLHAKASWLTCNETCVPEDAELTLTLPVGPSEPEAAVAAAFQTALKVLPASEVPWSISASENGAMITLSLTPQNPGGDPGELHFFSENQMEDSSAPQILEHQENQWTLTFPRHADTDPAPERVKGILKATQGWGDPAVQGWAIDVPLTEPTGPLATNSAGSPQLPVPMVLAMMFLGGMILNLMPCVFPVIGLKVMGFVQQAGHSRSKIVTHGLLFTLGVLLSFWILAGILLAGGIANWGGQLENPWVVYILLLVMLIFGLNMFGVFEVGTSATSVGGSLAAQQGLAGTFFSGVLATVVATPCSAPFLAPAIGVAVTLPGPLFFLAFTMMALGLSTPYLLLSAYPALVDKLPRPGAWMESFKQGMSFLLLGTAGYLLWVYSVHVFDQKGIQVMLGLTAIAAGFWVYGRWNLPSKSTRTRGTAGAVSLALVVTGFVIAKPIPAPSETELARPKIHWEPWTKELQEQLMAEGKPVYVDFTARWCLTCQTNKTATYTEDMARYFAEKGIIALKADKTASRPDIDEEIRKLGMSAIPVNVFYTPGSTTPHVTQTVLTENYLRGFLDEKLAP
ncbi:thiol:disulfide interchange protein DsbD [Haloferula luteola]|uniref:Thiol:disulfide interchange protein DsbD n=1 Tax=Haloferula luteola TaxID=595692 RepID=A0A840V9J9_9BACT|nr:thioredoxin family protein [Haloferula luteola]MBB5350630.1 thiol:disulfide interchange protein DsbD [Haloferula luteola]